MNLKIFPDLKPDQEKLINDFVPDKFFESADIDPIAVTLSLLESAESNEFIPQIEKQLDGRLEALDMISRTLNQNLLANYTGVLNAMNLISDLNEQLNIVASSIGQTRTVLQSARKEICDHPQTFFKQIQIQNNLNNIVKLVNDVSNIADSTEKLNNALKSNDYVTALKSCFTPSNYGSDVHQLTGVEGLVNSLLNMYSKVEGEMNAALIEQTIKYDRSIYSNLIQAYDILNKLAVVPQQLQQAFLERASTRFEQVMSNTDLTGKNKFKTTLTKLIDDSKDLLGIHQQIVNWHRGQEGFKTIQQTIEEMAKTLWETCENQVVMLLKKAPVGKFNFENFYHLLKSTTEFVQYGSTVVDLPGGKIILTIEDITSKYFKMYHQSTLEGTKQLLELDTWESCPSDKSFERSILTLSIPIKDIDSQAGTSLANINIPSAFEFDLSHTTNSCNNLIKMIHQYLSLIKMVPPLATEAFRGITELVEYYCLSALNIFLRVSPMRPFIIDQNNQMKFHNDNKILLSIDSYRCLKTIQRNFQDTTLNFSIPPNVPSSNPDEYLKQAVNAAEDMKGIRWYLLTIKNSLIESLPENAIGRLNRFYGNDVDNFLMNFAAFLFPFYGPNLINLTGFNQQFKNVSRWDFTEALINVHPYVGAWKEAATIFKQHVDPLNLEEQYYNNLWAALWKFSCYVLLNNFASVSKITEQGRCAMLSDSRSMLNDFVGFTEKKVNIDEINDWVNKYIEAYFYNAEDFKKWVSEKHKIYTFNQMNSFTKIGLSDQKMSRSERKEIAEFIKLTYKAS